MATGRAAWAVAGLAGGLVLSCSAGGGITPVQTAFNKGAYHQARKDWDGAIHEYEEALRQDSRDYRARFNLGLALEGRAGTLPPEERAPVLARAEEEYRLVLEQQPDNLRAGVNLAALEYERGDRERSRERLRGIIATHPEDAMPHAALGAQLLMEDDQAEAELLLRKARDLDPGGVQVNLLLGDCLARLGRMDEAEDAYLRAFETDSTELSVPMALAALKMAQGEAEEASSWLQYVLLVDADHAGAHQRMSEVQEALGDLEGAAWHLWRARDLDHDRSPEERAEDRQRLLSLYRRLMEQEGGSR